VNKKAVRENIDLTVVSDIVSEYTPFPEDAVIPALQKMQDAYGYLPQDAMNELARMTGIPVARIYGVATFYSQFHFKRQGKHTLRLCRGTACHVKGAGQILSAISRYLKIQDSETTDDLLFSIETVACLGTCFLSPVMLIGDQYYGELTPERAVAILKDLKSSHSKKTAHPPAKKGRR